MIPSDYSIDIADWTHDAQDIMNIRSRVFIDEQNVPAELEWDGLDQQCVQFLVRYNSRAIATARLKPDGQIGRMAVLESFRHMGVGTALLLAVMAYAEKNGFSDLYLHAQVQVVDFYRKHGFITEGEEFIDAGIAHRAMRKKIC